MAKDVKDNVKNSKKICRDAKTGKFVSVNDTEKCQSGKISEITHKSSDNIQYQKPPKKK